MQRSQGIVGGLVGAAAGNENVEVAREGAFARPVEGPEVIGVKPSL